LAWVEDSAHALDGWRKLDSLGRSLLGVTPDPIWDLLAAHAAEVPPAAQAAWLAAALPALHAYWAARLPEPVVLSEVLRDPARLYLTRTHVDVVFRLDQIRLELRAAGIDRDPGWVPGLGRVVAFHFE
jgi:hypothetical protein